MAKRDNPPNPERFKAPYLIHPEYQPPPSTLELWLRRYRLVIALAFAGGAIGLLIVILPHFLDRM